MKNKNFFKNKSILITGGTGSFGSAFLRYLIKNFKGFRKIVIFSRDELKQYNLNMEFPENKYPYLRFYLGDIRDLKRLEFVLEDIDYVIHAAALKQVPAAEINPFESIQTNVIGAQNIIQAALFNNVKKVVALSTDKAVAPINLYGATKLCSDKLFISANNIKGTRKISFSIARYGNVMGSRGSVIPVFQKQKKKGQVTLTDKNMTRFNIKLVDAIETVLWMLFNCVGGEVVIRKAPSYRIIDIKEAIAPLAKIKIIGIRRGEKIHEELITETDSFDTYSIDKYYLNLSALDEKNKKKFITKFKAKKVKKNFRYNSLENKYYLSVENIKKEIKNN
jgi:UDP-N-acetylglucosamine 4,6-dehydratase